MNKEPIKLLGYEKKGDIKDIPLFHFSESSIENDDGKNIIKPNHVKDCDSGRWVKASDIEVKYKLDPKTIKGLENFKGIVVLGVGRSAGLAAAGIALSKVTISARSFMDIGVSPEKLEKALLVLDESLICASEKLRVLDFVSRGDMLTELDEKKIFIESPSQDFNVKGQEPIWMKGRKRWK